MLHPWNYAIAGCKRWKISTPLRWIQVVGTAFRRSIRIALDRDVKQKLVAERIFKALEHRSCFRCLLI